jgi:cyclase
VSETIERIADGIWLGVPAPAEGSMAAIVDGGSMLVVDTTSYTVFAERFVAEVAAAAGVAGPTFLFITHRHFDHFGGSDAIRAPVIGHRLTREALARYTQDWLDRNIAEWTDAGMVIPELVRDPRVVLPSIVFDDRLVVHVGALEVELVHTGGHCADQTMVHVPARRVLLASDNIINGKPAFTGHGDLVTWIEALRFGRALEPELVVPGHGTNGGVEIIDTQIAELEELLERWLRGEE